MRSEALLAETLAFPEEAGNPEVRVDSHELMACTLFHQSAFTRALETPTACSRRGTAATATR